MKRKFRGNDSLAVENGDIVRLWITRILLPLGGYKEFITNLGYSDDRIASEIGLKTPLDDEEDDFLADFDMKEAIRSLRKCVRKFEKKADTIALPHDLDVNIQNLGKVLHLTESDKSILAFTVLLYAEEGLSEAAETLGSMTFNKVCNTLALTLDIPFDEVKLTLSRNGTLARSGIVYIDHNHSGRLSGKLEILSREFAARMLIQESDPVLLLRDTILNCTPPELSLDDYSHISSSLNILLPYLQKASEERKQGVNILIYGPPGTGKSQLSRVLAKKLEVTLYEISREDSDGDPIEGKRRLRSFRAAQNIFSGHDNILLFDEVEDIFGDGNSLFGTRSTASKHKGWINRILEESDVPTIWLTNSVHCMDPAFIRRFDMVVELSVPQQKQRTAIVEKLCSDLASHKTIGRIASSEDVSPAVIARATKVIRAIKDELPGDKVDCSLEHLVETTLLAQGHQVLSRAAKDELPDYYDPEVINADVNLTALADNLGNIQSGRLCIYGPPGTGKTAYARWLATRLDVPLHVKRASDLIDMYVGGTEKNIARAFREADEEKALLLIDEVDSFLQDRRKAQRSWEVTAVNEMLTQMESFSGIFIASTNLVDDLDQASLRRFDMKAKFDYLRPEQAWALFSKLSDRLGIAASPEARSLVNQLGVLTPGDYNVITRRHRFQPFSSATEIAKVLQQECDLKEDGKSKRSIGFIQSTTNRTDL